MKRFKLATKHSRNSHPTTLVSIAALSEVFFFLLLSFLPVFQTLVYVIVASVLYLFRKSSVFLHF